MSERSDRHHHTVSLTTRHRGSRRARTIAATGLVAMVVAAGTAVADDAPPPSSVGQSGRFTRFATPASVDLSALPRHTSPDTRVRIVVRLDTGGQLDGTPAAVVDAAQAQAIPAIEAAGAEVTATTDLVLNSVTADVAVADVAAVAAIPGVAHVHVSRRVTRANATSNAATGTDWAWSNYGATGAGTTIGIIDDGIDYYHAGFGGSGDPADFFADDGLSIEPGTFPTAKVLGGTDFVGDNYDADADAPGESPIPAPDDDPLGCGGHGTHVAGTAAGQGVVADGTTFTGPYTADVIAATSFLVAPGSAPEAGIYAYKVFGCDGSSDDAVILQAIERAVVDGVDVLNMSLGSAFGTADEPLALAIESATDAGVLVVVAAGNEGEGAYLVGSPSAANSALSVAATDAVAFNPGAGISGAVTTNAQNSNGFDLTTPVTGELVDVGLGCSVAEFAPAAGKIAIATRGVCTRVERAIHATDAGALGVIFVNSSAGMPPVEGPIPGATVPFIGVTPEQGATFLAAVGQVITIATGAPLPNPSFGQFASFSSNGPRGGDSAAKPDISAPGVNILSVGEGMGTGGMLLSGTSMATPHTAGIAALVRQMNPGLTPRQVKAAMMGTANPDAITGFSPRRGGAGLVAAYGALSPHTLLTTPDGLNNVSFGFAELTRGTTLVRTIDATNLTGAATTYDVSAWLNTSSIPGVSLTLSPRTIRIPAGETRSIRVRLRISDPAALPDAYDSDGGELFLMDGLLKLSPRNGSGRVVTPIVMVPAGLSDVRAGFVPATRTKPSALRVRNLGRHTGDVEVFQWSVTDDLGDSPDPRVPDLRHVGVSSFDLGGDVLTVFAINTADRWSTHAVNEYDIAIDVDLDGAEDFLLVVADIGLLTDGVPNGAMGVLALTAAGDPVSLYEVSAPANGSMVFVPMLASDLGITGPFVYALLSTTVVAFDTGVDLAGPAVFDPFGPAVSVGDTAQLGRNGRIDIPAGIDPDAAEVQDPLGWLVVTTNDAGGAAEATEVALP
jgi:subtilisin family serine protease